MADGQGPPDLVVLYAPPWFGPTRFSKHHLASYFAEHDWRVLYVEAPLTPLALRRGRAFLGEFVRTLRPARQVSKGLWVRRHILPVPYHGATWLTSRRIANRIGQRLLAPMIRRDLHRLGMSRPVLMAGLPHAADVVRFVPRNCLVYHCADDYASVGGFPTTLPEVEADLCRHADLVITTSETLCQERSRWNPNTHWVANGADVVHFGQPARPAPDVADLTGPVIGFVGGLSEWVDLELVAYAAAARPDWSFVMIGPAAIDTAVVRCLANVRLVGPRPYACLPSYLAAIDVGVIPFKCSPLTYHADPIKAYEYLAAGIPVVATELPALRRLDHVVRLAHSPRDFLAQLDAAVSEGREARRAERQAEAARHSWTARLRRIEQLIAECAS